MGCISSSEDKQNQPGSQDTPRKENAQITNKTPSSQLPTRQNQSQRSPPYETELSASLVDSSGANVPFHGLLTDAHKLNIRREATENPQNKLFDRSCHPLDDSQTPPSKPRLTVVTGVAMTMPYTVIVAKPSAVDDVKAVIQPVFERANAIFNGWSPASEISAFNKQPPEKKMKLSSDLITLFDTVDLVYDMSDGRFDPTTGVLSAAFENCVTERKRPPLPSEIAPFKHALGWKRRIQRKGVQGARLNSHTIVDLDGISKGHVVDLLIDALSNSGFSSCYVDWAGDIRAMNEHPDGRPWRSAVIRPPALPRVFQHWRDSSLRNMLNEDDIAYFANYSSSAGDGCAIATSGDYFSVQKYGFHHITNLTEMSVMKASAASVGSICVAAKTCAIADALSTAAMTFSGVDDAVDFLQQLKTRHPDTVYGYCAMGRNSSNKNNEVFTEDIFATAMTIDDQTQHPQENAVVNDISLDESKRLTDFIRENIFLSTATIHLDETMLEIDSLVSCSMDPYPLVTFSAPPEFVQSLHDRQDSTGVTLRCSVRLNSDSASLGPENNVNVNLRLSEIKNFENIAFLSAIIEDVDFGNIVTYTVSYKHKKVVQHIDLRVPRSKFRLIPTLQKAKTFLRHNPGMVWVITTKAADQAMFALTASSVCVPRHAQGYITFNISHTSAFFAGFGGVKSILRVHALSMELSKLGLKFVDECRPTDVDSSELESQAVVSAVCIVEHVVTIQDHDVVAARVCEISEQKDNQRLPLVWVGGNYVDW